MDDKTLTIKYTLEKLSPAQASAAENHLASGSTTNFAADLGTALGAAITALPDFAAYTVTGVTSAVAVEADVAPSTAAPSDGDDSGSMGHNVFGLLAALFAATALV